MTSPLMRDGRDGAEPCRDPRGDVARNHSRAGLRAPAVPGDTPNVLIGFLATWQTPS